MSCHLRFFAAAAAVLGLFLIMSCNNKPDKILTDSDNGTSITVETGDIIAVRLQAQLGTGFSWKPEIENESLEQMGEPTQESGEEIKTGGMDTQEFRFRAVSEGTSILSLAYGQPWAEDAAPEMKFIVTVTVH